MSSSELEIVLCTTLSHCEGEIMFISPCVIQSDLKVIVHVPLYVTVYKKKMVALIILIIALQFDVSTSCNDSLR